MRRLRVLVILSLLSNLGFAEEVKPVEPEIRADFEKAKELLPEVIRDRTRDVKLERREDLGIGKEMPLEYRLLSRAAYASFNVLSRSITVYDAGATGKPEWKDSAPSPEQVAKFLAQVSDLLGVKAPAGGDDPALQPAWTSFVTKVYSWEEKKVPDPVPPIGDPVVWNQFLEHGVWRAMGGKVDRVPMLVHEFAHAVQLESEITSMMSRMKYWAALSGFVEARSGDPADGFAGGKNKTENAMVLIRLLLSDDPAAVKRGESADYEVAPDATFVNRYARYDLREDYAESFRLMIFEPGRLAKEAPGKFLYLNALGWNARLDLGKPGPMWYSGEELERFLPKDDRKKVFEQLFGRDGKGLGLSKEALVAVLRAHQEELTSDDLPEPSPAQELPGDLPKEIRRVFESPELSVRINRKVYPGSSGDEREKLDEVIARWISLHEFEVGIMKLQTQGTEGVAGAYRETQKIKDANKREQRYKALREAAWSLVSAEEWKTMDASEAEFHRSVPNVVPAFRYHMLGSEKQVPELLKEIEALVAQIPSEYDQGRLIGTGVDLLLRDRRAEAFAQIRKIPGETVGRWLRVKYLKMASDLITNDSYQKAAVDRMAMIEAARKEVEACQFPQLKKQIALLLSE